MTLVVAAVALLVSLAGSVELEGLTTPLPPDAVPLAASRFCKRISAASAAPRSCGIPQDGNH